MIYLGLIQIFKKKNMAPFNLLLVEFAVRSIFNSFNVTEY